MILTTSCSTLANRATIECGEESWLDRIEFVHELSSTLTLTLFLKNLKEPSLDKKIKHLLMLLIRQDNNDNLLATSDFSFTQGLPKGIVPESHTDLDMTHAHDFRFQNYHAHRDHPHHHIEYANIKDPYPLMQQLVQMLMDFDKHYASEKEQALFSDLHDATPIIEDIRKQITTEEAKIAAAYRQQREQDAKEIRRCKLFFFGAAVLATSVAANYLMGSSDDPASPFKP